MLIFLYPMIIKYRRFLKNLLFSTIFSYAPAYNIKDVRRKCMQEKNIKVLEEETFRQKKIELLQKYSTTIIRHQSDRFQNNPLLFVIYEILSSNTMMKQLGDESEFIEELNKKKLEDESINKCDASSSNFYYASPNQVLLLIDHFLNFSNTQQQSREKLVFYHEYFQDENKGREKKLVI